MKIIKLLFLFFVIVNWYTTSQKQDLYGMWLIVEQSGHMVYDCHEVLKFEKKSYQIYDCDIDYSDNPTCIIARNL